MIVGAVNVNKIKTKLNSGEIPEDSFQKDYTYCQKNIKRL